MVSSLHGCPMSEDGIDQWRLVPRRLELTYRATSLTTLWTMRLSDARVLACGALVSWSLVALPANAQVPTLVDIGGNWTPSAGLVLPDEVQEAVPTADPKVQVSELTARFNIPIRLSDKALLMPGVGYGIRAFSQSTAVLGQPENRELHEISASLLFMYSFNESWSLLAQVAPAFAGDFANVDGDHFRIGGAAIVSYAFSKRFTLGAGVGANYQFGALLPLPALRIDWQIADSLRLSGLLPRTLLLRWQLGDRLELGLSTSIAGQSYAITSDRVQQSWPCQGQDSDLPLTPFDEREADRERCFSNLAFSRGDVGPLVGVRLFSSVWLSARVSYLFFRRYEFLNDDNETPDFGDQELDNAVSVTARLEFRIPSS